MFKNKKISLVLGALLIVAVVSMSTLVFAQTTEKTTEAVTKEAVDKIVNRIHDLSSKYKDMKLKDARFDAVDLLYSIESVCGDLKLDCSTQIKDIKIGIKGATKDALVEILKDNWGMIYEQTAPKKAVEFVNASGVEVPEALATLYEGTSFEETAKETAKELGKMIIVGSISEGQVQDALRDVFGAAAADTAAFAGDLVEKYNLTNIATTILKDPKNTKAIKKAISQELQNYAEQEMNKLANQAIGTLFPVFQGVQIDFTNLNSKTLKSTLRNTIVNAMAQSYLGPQYVAVYLAVSAACPPCMEKAHAELRRFDKKYLQPGTEKIGAEWDRFEDSVKEESERVGKQISAEWKRLKERLEAEYNRQKEQVEAEVKRAKESFQAELKRAEESRIGKEIERQLTDISDATESAVDTAKAELERELEDAAAEVERFGKKVGAEVERHIADVKAEIEKVGKKAKAELKREVKSVTNTAQKAKEKIEAELKRAAAEAKRAAEKVEAEAKRAAEKVKEEANRLKDKGSSAVDKVKKEKERIKKKLKW